MHVHLTKNWRFLIWRLTPKSPNRQNKTTTKISHYPLYIRLKCSLVKMYFHYSAISLQVWGCVGYHLQSRNSRRFHSSWEVHCWWNACNQGLSSQPSKQTLSLLKNWAVNINSFLIIITLNFTKSYLCLNFSAVHPHATVKFNCGCKINLPY